MSFYVWCEIVCEGCADTIPGQHTKGGVPRRELAALAKRFKWQRRGVGRGATEQEAIADLLEQIEERAA